MSEWGSLHLGVVRPGEENLTGPKWAKVFRATYIMQSNDPICLQGTHFATPTHFSHFPMAVKLLLFLVPQSSLFAFHISCWFLQDKTRHDKFDYFKIFNMYTYTYYSNHSDKNISEKSLQVFNCKNGNTCNYKFVILSYISTCMCTLLQRKRKIKHSTQKDN